MEGNQSSFLTVCVNASDSSATREFWEIPDITAGRVTAAFLLLLVTVGLTCNIMLTVVIIRERLYKEPFVIMLLSGVVNDLLFILCASYFHITTGIRGEFGSASSSDGYRCLACQAGLVVMIDCIAALFTTALFSFDRFLFFYRPLKYEQLMTRTRTLLALAVVWILATLLGGFQPLVGFGHIAFIPFFLTCHVLFVHSVYGAVLLTIIAVPIVICIVLDSWLAVIVLKNIRAVYMVKKSLGNMADWLSQQENQKIFREMERKRYEKEVGLMKLYVGIVFITLITWLPVIIVGVGVGVSEQIDVFPSCIYHISLILFFTQVVSNPVLAIIIFKDVKTAFKNTIHCCCRREARCGLCEHCDNRSNVTSSSQRPN